MTVTVLLIFANFTDNVGIYKKLGACQNFKRKWIISFYSNETGEQQQNKSLNPKEICPRHSALKGFPTNTMTKNSFFVWNNMELSLVSKINQGKTLKSNTAPQKQ